MSIIRKEGHPFIAISALVSLFLVFAARLRVIGLVPVVFVTWFFRDPQRDIPEGDDLVLSPADGTVSDISEVDDEHIGTCTKVSVFMSVFNVHVNRASVSGTVMKKSYRPGKFHMANIGKKTEENERMIHYIKNQDGVFRIDQVAGLIARRISFWPKEEASVDAGQRIGLIRFGSLLECYMPKNVNIAVNKGDTVYAGESVIGRIIR